jgi:hypothetical protein
MTWAWRVPGSSFTRVNGWPHEAALLFLQTTKRWQRIGAWEALRAGGVTLH